MRKLCKKSVLALLVFLMAGNFLFASGGQEEPAPQAAPAKEEAPMTHDELVAAAQAEGKVVVYSITSRIAKAAEAFTEKYGIEVEASNMKDFELIEKISKEGSTGALGADFVICQDGGRGHG